MSTNNTENLGFKVLTMGRDEFDTRQSCNFRPVTLAKLYDWIDSKRIDVKLKTELKKSAAAYPQQALGAWMKMYSRHLATAQKKIQEKPIVPKEFLVELGDEPKREVYEENCVPFNSEFDDEPKTKENYVPFNKSNIGRKSSSEDQSGQSSIHSNVPDDRIGGSGFDSEHSSE